MPVNKMLVLRVSRWPADGHRSRHPLPVRVSRGRSMSRRGSRGSETRTCRRRSWAAGTAASGLLTTVCQVAAADIRRSPSRKTVDPAFFLDSSSCTAICCQGNAPATSAAPPAHPHRSWLSTERCHPSRSSWQQPELSSADGNIGWLDVAMHGQSRMRMGHGIESAMRRTSQENIGRSELRRPGNAHRCQASDGRQWIAIERIKEPRAYHFLSDEGEETLGCFEYVRATR